MLGIGCIKLIKMITRYKWFLYKLFTMPNFEGVRSQVSSTFWTMILLQTANVVSILFLIRYLFPNIDLRNFSKFTLFMLFTFPLIVFNYRVIYHKNGYKKILNEFSKEKKGSLKYLVVYFLITISFFLLSAMLVVEV